MYWYILVLTTLGLPFKSGMPWFNPNLKDSTRIKVQMRKKLPHYLLISSEKLHSKEIFQKFPERRQGKDEVMINGKRYRKIEKGDLQVLLLVNGKESEKEIEKRGMEILNGLRQKGGDTLGYITGTVTDTAGNPIQGIEFWVWSLDGSSAYSSGSWTTDSLGHYLISGVDEPIPFDSCKIQTDNSIGYIHEWWNNKQDFSSADSIIVRYPDTLKNIDFQLQLGGVITGRVTDMSGNPISGVGIEALTMNGDWVNYGWSNDSGYYYVNGLETGEYKLPTWNGSGYIDEWYNDKTDFTSADTVYVNAPDTTKNIDFQLQLGGVIAGRVTGMSGTPISGVNIEVYDLNGDWAGWSSTNDSGYYYVNKLPSGEYKLRTWNRSGYIDEWYNDKTDFTSADTVYVNAPDTTKNIDFQLQLEGVITGRVTGMSGTPISGVNIEVYDLNKNWVRWNFTNDSGYYWAGGLNGEYKVKAYPWGTDYVSLYYNNKVNWDSADTVSVLPGDTTKNIDFQLYIGGKIKGNVYSATKGPLQGIEVDASISSTGEVINGSFTDSSGEYRIPGLPTTSYKIWAFPDMWMTNDTIHCFEWYQDKDNWNDAISLSVNAPDSITGIDFILEDGGHIEGNVYRKDDLTPIENVSVYGWMWFTPFYGWLDFFEAVTDSTGSYRINNLRTGQYKASAHKSGYDEQWYDQKSDSTSADLINVTAGDTIPSINFYLGLSGIQEKTADNGIRKFALTQNRPNPFTNHTIITFSIPKTTKISLKVYNICGQVVNTLVDEEKKAGIYSLNWNGVNKKGKKLPSGIYFYRLKADNAVKVRKLILLR